MNEVEITGWEEAEKVIKALVINGYQVLVEWDGEFNPYYTGDQTLKRERTYRISYVHPRHEDNQFILENNNHNKE